MTSSVPDVVSRTLAIAALALIVAACGASHQSQDGGGGPQAVAFADCMRAHGIPSFPDPGPGGGFDLSSGSGIDPSSPAFKAAGSACAASAPPAPDSHPISAAQDRLLLTLARCMRAHGVTRYPDPTPDDLIANKQTILRLDPSSPEFQKAAARCGDPGLFDRAGQVGGVAVGASAG